jgi:2-dehydro-3-deoxyphosphogluconate aldolase/(4S)-4-hydroxy-2-oxoglutarate aldolase
VNETRIAIPPRIIESGVVAIGRRLDRRTAVEIGEGLAAGGVGAFEITFGDDDVLAAIEALASRFARHEDDPELLIGAGTVLTIAQAERALGAGARFLVMPVTDPALVAWAADRGVPAFPGAMTPTEALAGWRAGAAGIKLFPASVTGPAFIRELHGPFPEIPLIPTGGVTVETAPDFIAAGAVAVGMGSWLTGDGHPERIAERGRRVVAAIRAARRGDAA